VVVAAVAASMRMVRMENMVEIVLVSLVVIGVFVFWCDVTGSWNDVLRRVRALLPPHSK
jgi:hypothetical protein